MNYTWLTLILVLIIVLFWWYQILRFTVFRMYRMRKDSDNDFSGQPVTGTVLSSQKYGSGRFTTLKINVEFPNFAMTPVTQEFRFVDTRPDENRYDVGKRVGLTLYREGPKGPSVKLVGGKAKISTLYLLFTFILLSGAGYGTWWLYTQTQNALNKGLSDTQELFADSGAMPLMGIIFLGTLIFQYFLFKWIGKLLSPKRKTSHQDLKFFGKKAMATILSYKDTNMSINDNPVVKFEYTYQDHQGRDHRGEDRMVVGKLDIGQLPTLKEKEVIFLADNPAESLFIENLKPSFMGGCLKGILLFEAFIFSAIILAGYIASISL